MSVHGASKQFQVPLTTLRDRVDGRISIDVVLSGPPPLFTQEQESYINEHIKTMSEIGYGYTRAEVLNLASDYAVDLGIREKRKDLTMKCYYNFMRRWPDLHTVKPSELSKIRAEAASPECKADISDTSRTDITTDEKVPCPADSFFNKRGGIVLLALENAKKAKKKSKLNNCRKGRH
uniref:HTH psq-type domain-containing protein n=1 Tax=Magallana gigas TaxID=29159 RepID=A0A8W8NV40_MAGGI